MATAYNWDDPNNPWNDPTNPASATKPKSNIDPATGQPYGPAAGATQGPTADLDPNPPYVPPVNTDPPTDEWWKTTQAQWTADDPTWRNPGITPTATDAWGSPILTADAPPGATDQLTPRTTTPPPGGPITQGQGTPTYFGGPGTLAGYTGDTKPVDPAQWTQFTADLGVGQDKGDHAQVKTLATRLQQAGYSVALGPTDEADQLDSLYINGQLVRVFDSSGRWTYQPDTPNAPAWDMPGPSGGGSAGPLASHAGSDRPDRHLGAGGQTLPGGDQPILVTDTPSPTTSSNTNTNPLGGQAQSLYDLLMKRATQSLGIDGSDPIIKNQTDAFDASQQRAARNYLQGVAERVGSNANISAEGRASAEQIGINDAQFQAQLIQQELSARRSEIQQALSGAAGLLTSQQQMALQKELQLIQLAQQDRQFNQSLKQSAEQFAASLGYNYASLSQADRQFLAQLQARSYEFDMNDRFRNSPLGSP